MQHHAPEDVEMTKVHDALLIHPTRDDYYAIFASQCA
jgi:hypothetical protein